MTSDTPPTPEELHRLFAGEEPEALRDYLFVVREGQQLILGSTVAPVDRGYRQTLANIWIPAGSRVPQPLDMFMTYITVDDYLEPLPGGLDHDLSDMVEGFASWGPFRSRISDLAVLTTVAEDVGVQAALMDNYADALGPGASERFSNARRQGADGPARRLLSRQGIFLAMKEVLQHPDDDDRSPEGGIIRAIGLIHAISSDLYRRPDNQSIRSIAGMSTPLVMEIIQNELFHRADDTLSTLYRHYLLWTRYAAGLERTTLRSPPSDMLLEATGLDPMEWMAFGIAVWAQRSAWTPDKPLWVDRDYISAADRAKRDIFFSHVASTPEEFNSSIAPDSGPWDFLAFQQHPLLLHDDSYLLLDESSLIDRITRGLFWDVHDHEDEVHGGTHRVRWNQAHGEMIERYVTDTAQGMAPVLLGHGQTFYSERELMEAYDTKVCDAAIDYGGDMCLIEVVGGQVTTGTRLRGDLNSFVTDTERLVIEKAEQLHEIADAILNDERALTGCPPPAARRVFPVLVGLGTYPVNPSSVAHVEQRLAENKFFSDPRVQSLAIIDLGELEILAGWSASGGPTMPDALDAWKRSALAAVSLRNWGYAQPELRNLEWRSPLLMEGSIDLFERSISLLGLGDNDQPAAPDQRPSR